MKPRHHLIAVAIAAVALASCASGEKDRDLERLPQYQAGYRDGCQTALKRERGFASEIVRNKAAFEQDAAYRAGWRDGSMTCGPADGLGRDPTYDDTRIGPEPLL